MKVKLKLEFKTVQHFSNTLEVEMPDELTLVDLDIPEEKS